MPRGSHWNLGTSDHGVSHAGESFTPLTPVGELDVHAAGELFHLSNISPTLTRLYCSDSFITHDLNILI